MKTTVTESSFIRDFMAIRPDNFTRSALLLLWDYYDQLESDTGEELEFDPVAICCDWSEYPSARKACEEMSGWEADPEASDVENEEAAMEYLRDHTTVLGDGDCVVVLAF